jgi:hypothetical protein
MKRAFLIGAALVTIITGCSISYRVAVPSSFENLHPRHNKINYLDAVLRQTYYPLIFQDADGDMRSSSLDMTKTKQVTKDATHFQFCLTQDLKFWDETHVATAHLLESLNEILSIKNMAAEIAQSENNGCVSVHFQKSRPQFFAELTGVDSTVLKDSKVRHMPVGLGPFRPNQISKNRLELHRNSFRSGEGDIDELIFATVPPSDGAQSNQILENEFDEWNFYNGVIDISLDKANRKIVLRPSVKTMVAWISIKDDCKRTKIWSALRSQFDEVRRISVANETLKIPGILPIGVPGFEEQTPETLRLPEKCNKGGITADDNLGDAESIPLFAVYSQMHGGLRTMLGRAKLEDTEPKIEFVNLDDDAVMKLMQSGKDFVGIISTSSPRSRLSDLLEFLINVSPGKSIEGLGEILLAMDADTDPQTTAEQARKAHRLALDSGYILPIGQLNTTLSFPNFITDVAFRDQFQTSPDYSGYKVNSIRYWWDRFSRGDK